MLWRIVSLLLCQLVGGVLGWFAASESAAPIDALLGVVTGGLVWFLIDLVRGLRLLDWLRGGDLSVVVVKTGLWGEVSERVRRMMRVQEKMLQESDKRLQDFLAAMQASPNGVVLLDAQGRIEWFNQTAGLHFGLDVKRDLLQHFGNLVRNPEFARYFAAQDFAHELLMTGRESTATRPVRLSVHLHAYGQGRLLLLSRDVTALEQAEAMRRDFVANVSHEIRTPLTVLAGFVETLQTLPLPPAEQGRYLDLMAQQAERMQTLVSDLLMLSRLEGSPLPDLEEWTPLRSLMRQLEQDAHSLSCALNPAGGKMHQLVFESAPDVELGGAATELFSAMSNLVSNAIRYTPPGGEIRVRLDILDDGGAELCVSDSGPGIAPEHIPRLTERFYRVDRSRSRDTGGTGLGLAIVKHVLQRHGAALKIESTLGKGSQFTITLPASRVRIKG